MSPTGPSPPVHFLHTLGNVFTSVGLYKPDHPARGRALEAAFQALEVLLAERSTVGYSLIEGEVVFGAERLRELDEWPWSGRLSRAGVGRLEFLPGVDLAEWNGFVAEIAARLELAGEPGAVGPHPRIRFGPVAVVSESEEPAEPQAPQPPLELAEEAEAVRWIHERAEATETVATQETAAVVRALFVAIRSARSLVAPLLEIKHTDEYTTNHCMNVSLLAMSLAEQLRLADADVLAIGEAALLHDIGKTRIPLKILNKPGQLTRKEREVVQWHVVEGARMLLRSDDRNPLSAVVAYEHHMHWDGEGGYPKVKVSYRPHRFSRLVQICDVYDALRTRRPYRPAFTREAAMEFLRREAGQEFDPDLVDEFLAMMRRWEPKLVESETEVEEPEGGTAEVEELIRKCKNGYDADIERTLYAS
ncbi:MAG: HD-GYP domain-containing protein [Gemmatimonadota bacterium]